MTDCGSCALHGADGLQRLGRTQAQGAPVVALAGNPNTGKSTLFNSLTGLRQRVGNWPGTTVVRSEGTFRYRGSRYRVVDLPGTYSLLSAGKDEEVARDALLFDDPRVTVVVVDASRLERNLPLVLQVLEITSRVVVAANLIDEARQAGLELDLRHLRRELSVPVVATTARSGEGLPELLAEIASVAEQGGARPRALRHPAPHIEKTVERLAASVSREFPAVRNSRWLALRLLEDDPTITEAVLDGRLARLGSALSGRSA
jgi:small GTP-binding protein